MAKKRKWGRWECSTGVLSEGGQGRLYLVNDSLHEYEGDYVLKELKNIKRKDRFIREIGSLSRLQDTPYIVPVVDYGTWGKEERPAYVMPRADSSLRELVQEPLSIERVVSLYEDILKGVVSLHSHSLVHRDLKPENILLFGGTAKVADLGLVYDPEEQRLTDTLEAVGPRFFMAPELENGRYEEIGGRV